MLVAHRAAPGVTVVPQRTLGTLCKLLSVLALASDSFFFGGLRPHKTRRFHALGLEGRHTMMEQTLDHDADASSDHGDS